jgi:hypothetical protein
MADESSKPTQVDAVGPVTEVTGRRRQVTGGTLSLRELNSTRGRDLVVGRLTEHGSAPYQFRAEEKASYYVKVLTSRGPKTIWGKDLERAILSGETRPKIGELVGARRSGRDAVTVTTRQRDASGRIIVEQEQLAHRTRWVVEKVQFFAERVRLARRLRDEQADVRKTVRSHPELKSTYLSVRAAEDFAARRIADPKDRERFLLLMREAMAASIKNGEPLPATRLKDRAKAEEPVKIGKAPTPEDPSR